MSGGSWGYVYEKFNDVSERLLCSKEPERRVLGRKVALMSDAMHAIEWNDSGDGADEVSAIRRALGKDATKLILVEVIQEAKEMTSKLLDAIKTAEYIS